MYGTVRTVVWEDGGREAASYPILKSSKHGAFSAYSVLRHPTASVHFCIPNGIPGIQMLISGIQNPPPGIPMGAKSTRLSEAKIKAAKPRDKDYVLSDGGGLQLRVRIIGSKLWNFNYHHPITKKRINMGLGIYPELSLAQARKMTVEARELLALGVDPKEHREASGRAKKAATEHTFQNVATAWYELKKDSVTQAYAEDIWRSLTLHVSRT